MSISGLQHGISCPELTSLIRPTPPSPEGFWGSHGGIHEGKHNFIIFNHVFSTNLKSSWWAKYRKTKGGQWAGWPASSTSWVWVQLCHPSLIRRVMSPLLALLLGFPKWCVGGYWGVVLDLISPFFFLFGHDHRTDGIHMCGIFLGVCTDFEKPSKMLWGNEGIQHFEITTDISSLAKPLSYYGPWAQIGLAVNHV